MATLRRVLHDPGTSFFLFGPRGTGKSTWLRETFPDALHIDLLSPELTRSYQARPERLRELIDGNPDAAVIVLDEVQRVPELLPVVHQAIAQRKTPRFVLTGSSSRRLKRTGVDLLAGRAVLRSMHPFLACELGEAFDVDASLTLGMLPLVVDAARPEETLRAYVALYIREEVQAEGLVRDLGGFSRFVEAVTFSHGAVLNVSEVARECEVSRKTVEGYLEILEDLLLAFRVPAFNRRARRQLSARPKLYLFDAGVFRSVRPSGPLDRPEEIDGAALEGLVAQHLRAWCTYRSDGHSLSYWRTKAGLEVDFVVYGPEGLWAFEVKRQRTVRSKDTKALRAFRTDYPEARATLLYLGDESLRIDDVQVTPCAGWLPEVVPDQTLPS